ncbi:MAG: hypothetical protein N3F07_04255 [Candidatus Micrarchaeota archaeon]|nr:hypothetical protein [Candidatus Micrarchaeota archaeon]
MKQLTIVVDDKVGVIADISYILGKAKINIEAISAEVYGGKGIINLMVKDEQKAAKLLSANGYKVLESELIIVKLKDEPGRLSEVSALLKDAGINISNLYLLARGNGVSIDAISVDKPKKARKVLAEYLVGGKEWSS